MSFLRDSIDFFTGARVAHMGMHQYASHAGIRHGQPSSGAALWAQAEKARNRLGGNLVSSETGLLCKVADEIGNFVPSNLPVVELGPGTLSAFVSKTLPIIHELKSSTYVPVDESASFLKQIASVGGIPFAVKPIVDDFFSNEQTCYTDNALICSFGSTISNIINPLSNELPYESLTKALASMARASQNGWLLVGFDGNQNGNQIKEYFAAHDLFQLNIFDRMAVELPMGGFDPLAFDYEPIWVASSGQLAHMAILNRDMDFTLMGRRVFLQKGQELHIKNSYKYHEDFFTRCCEKTGLHVAKIWSDNSTVKVYLLEKRFNVESALLPLISAKQYVSVAA